MLYYWDINVMICMAAITLKNYLGDLKETNKGNQTIKNNSNKARLDKESRKENNITKT